MINRCFVYSKIHFMRKPYYFQEETYYSHEETILCLGVNHVKINVLTVNMQQTK